MSQIEFMQKPWNAVLIPLVQSDHATDGQPFLSDQDRADLQSLLTYLLVRPEELSDYVLQVRDLLQKNYRHGNVLPEETRAQVFAHGLAALANVELARLALNEVALVDLADGIAMDVPAAWVDGLVEAGAEFRREVGWELPPMPQRPTPTRQPAPPPTKAQREESSLMVALRTRGKGETPAETVPDLPPAPPRWTFVLKAEECQWRAGQRAANEEPTATVRLEWDETQNELRVAMGGFLALARGYASTVVWTNAAGTVLAQAQAAGRQALRLQPSTAHPPRPRDRLTIDQTKHPYEDNPGWTVHLEVLFQN